MVSSVASFFSSLLLFCLAIQSRTLLCSSECICLYVWLQICVCAFVQAVGSAKERGGQVGEKKKRVLLAEHPHSIKLKYLLVFFPWTVNNMCSAACDP